MTYLAGPMPCISCGQSVWWDRVGSFWRLMQGRAHHECPGERVVHPPKEPESPLCNAYMLHSGAICARKRGHSMSGGHRSRAVMDDEAARRRSRMAA